ASYRDTIRDLVLGPLPVATAYDFVDFPGLTPLLRADEADDRWAFARGMAEEFGMELYFNAEGSPILRPIPAIVVSSQPVAYLVEGQDGVQVAGDPMPSLLDLTKHLSRTDAHNKWIVTGENPNEDGPAPRAEAVDDNPTSPTRYGGPFGMKPDFYSSSFISTNEQAQQAASGRKARE